MKKTSWVKNNPPLKGKKIAIVFHEATSGVADDLRDFLLKEGVAELLFIAHPLLYLKENFRKSSRYEMYVGGKCIKEGKAFHWVLPEILLYAKDCLYTFFWCLFLSKRIDIFIGIGNVNAFTGLILRQFLYVNKVIYYVIDYVPIHFQNTIINTIYHTVEKIAALYSNWTWNLSPRMIEARNRRWGIKFPNQLVMFHGVAFNRIKRVPFEKVHKSEILFMGTLLKKQGIQLLIEALGEIRQKIPNVKLIIIGKGPYEIELKQLTKKMNLLEQVEFLGYIPDQRQVENRIAQAALAIALYDKQSDEFTYYADPGKIKNYLGAGVPVIMTDVPFIASQVVQAKCGFIVEYNKEELSKTILSFFTNTELMKMYRLNAIAFAREYDWKKIFKRGFQNI